MLVPGRGVKNEVAVRRIHGLQNPFNRVQASFKSHVVRAAGIEDPANPGYKAEPARLQPGNESPQPVLRLAFEKFEVLQRREETNPAALETDQINFKNAVTIQVVAPRYLCVPS